MQRAQSTQPDPNGQDDCPRVGSAWHSLDSGSCRGRLFVGPDLALTDKQAARRGTLFLLAAIAFVLAMVVTGCGDSDSNSDLRAKLYTLELRLQRLETGRPSGASGLGYSAPDIPVADPALHYCEPGVSSLVQ